MTVCKFYTKKTLNFWYRIEFHFHRLPHVPTKPSIVILLASTQNYCLHRKHPKEHRDDSPKLLCYSMFICFILFSNVFCLKPGGNQSQFRSNHRPAKVGAYTVFKENAGGIKTRSHLERIRPCVHCKHIPALNPRRKRGYCSQLK